MRRSIAGMPSLLELARLEQEALAKAAAERQRLARMSSAELAAEIRWRRPRDAMDLAGRDPAVLKAKWAHEALERRSNEAARAVGQLQTQIKGWHDSHKWRAWLHDEGLGHAPPLRELEQQLVAQRDESKRLESQLDAAEKHLRVTRDHVYDRIKHEQAPIRARLGELEALRQEKARLEREAQPRPGGSEASEPEPEPKEVPGDDVEKDGDSDMDFGM